VAKIANGRIRSVEEFLNYPQLAGRDRWREVGPQCFLQILLPPVTMAGAETKTDQSPTLESIQRQSLRGQVRSRSSLTRRIDTYILRLREMYLQI
jgi:hypothetical protein